jgi:type II secretory pathway pseudopilin PulG
MIFVRTALGALVVACMIALAAFGYRLWQLERQLAARVQALEEQVASAQADIEAIRASYDLPITAPASEEDAETEEKGEVDPERP